MLELWRVCRTEPPDRRRSRASGSAIVSITAATVMSAQTRLMGLVMAATFLPRHGLVFDSRVPHQLDPVVPVGNDGGERRIRHQRGLIPVPEDDARHWLTVCRFVSDLELAG